MGPFSIPTLEGFRYFLTLVDDCIRTTWLYLVSLKFESSMHIPTFFSMIDTQFHDKIKCIKSDNASDLKLLEFFINKGHKFSFVATPQQNSVVERKHQHILEMVRALKFQSNIPIHFLGDCVLIFVCLINRLHCPLLHNKSPYEQLFHHPPFYEHLKTFGSLCFVTTLTQNRSIFYPRFKPCVFIGYLTSIKGYKVLDLATRSIFCS